MSFQAIALSLFRAHCRSRAFLSVHLLLWSYFLIQRSHWDWNALHRSMGLYATLLALYLCAGVLSNEFKSHNAELILLRGVSPERLYWYHFAATLSLGIALVLATGCVFFAPIPADQRIVYVLVDALNQSQFVTVSQKHRDPRFPPYAFTQEGVAMLSSVLKSKRAVRVNILIMRAFV